MAQGHKETQENSLSALLHLSAESIRRETTRTSRIRFESRRRPLTQNGFLLAAPFSNVVHRKCRHVLNSALCVVNKIITMQGKMREVWGATIIQATYKIRHSADVT